MKPKNKIILLRKQVRILEKLDIFMESISIVGLHIWRIILFLAALKILGN